MFLHHLRRFKSSDSTIVKQNNTNILCDLITYASLYVAKKYTMIQFGVAFNNVGNFFKQKETISVRGDSKSSINSENISKIKIIIYKSNGRIWKINS